MEVTVENVEIALTQFYRTNSSLQAEAHQWLVSLQDSPHAWSFVWDLLQPNRSCEAQFFASNTLHLKILNNWNEVPQNEYENLKAKILNTIVAYSNGPKIVLNRLCIALAVYVIRVSPRFWSNAIEDIHKIFRPENLPDIPAEKTVWILLEVLSVIPDELQSITLMNAHRTTITAELRRSCSLVMSTFDSMLEYKTESQNDLKSLAAKGVSKWVLLGGIALTECLNVARKLVEIIDDNQSLDPYESCEHEIEALVQIMTNPLSHDYKCSVLPALEIVLRLAPRLQNSESHDFVVNLINLYIAIGETHGSVLLSHLASNDSSNAQIVITWLRCLLACLSTSGSYPKYENYSHLVISFWSSLHDEKNSLPEDQKSVVSNILEPIYKEVCRILLLKSQHPPDDVVLTASESELFRIYRQDIADTIVNCYIFVRNFLIPMLESTLRNAKTWQEVESVLHLVYSLAETTWNCEEDDVDELGLDETVVLGKVGEEERKAVISLLISVPPNLVNVQVINSLNLAIGVYAEWWSIHPDILGCLIPNLINSLQNPATSTNATMALKDITRECTTSIQPYAESLLLASANALESNRLNPDERIRLMFSVGKLLSIIPYENMLTKLEVIINDNVAGITHILSQPKNDASRDLLLTTLRMLANLGSSMYLAEKVNVDPPVMIVLRKLLPYLREITHQWSFSSVVVEEVCKCLKSFVVSLVDYPSIPLIGNITKVALEGYTEQPNTAMLELSRQLYIMFWKSPPHRELLTDLIRTVSDKTMSFAMNNKASSSSDVMQHYFNLMNTIGKRSAPLLESTIDLNNLFNFAIAALNLPEHTTVNASCQFITTIIVQSGNFQTGSSVVENNGKRLVGTILKCLGSDSTPRSSLNPLADVLCSLNKTTTTNLARWLQSSLSAPNFPTEKATPVAKTAFVRAVLRERVANDRLHGAVKEFSFICRGIVQFTASTS